MMTYQQQQQSSSTSNINESVNKEEKIALARQRLKQFKKEKEKESRAASLNALHNSNNTSGSNGEYVSNELMINVNNPNAISGRSTPSSVSSGSFRPTLTSLNQNEDANFYQHQQQLQYQMQHQQQTNLMNNEAMMQQPQSQIHPLKFQQSQASPEQQINLKEQLQLHVQTIGILVAEKAELQSKLHQQSKKCDKKQDECDELMGRLKASRQKISDLEKLVQQLDQSISVNNNVNGEYSNSPNGGDSSRNNELDILRTELNTNQLLIDELKMRLNEANEKLSYKQQETQKLGQLTLELKSQLEIMQLKMQQINESQNSDQTNNENGPAPTTNEEIQNLKEQNVALEAKLAESNKLQESKTEKLKTEYQTYVEQLRRQIEGLVDQINRMSDERESSFAKIDHLETLLSNANKLNQTLTQDLSTLNAKISDLESNKQSNQQNNSNVSNDKYQLLENEIKYFKQQIDILLVEQSQYKQLLDDKDQSLANLQKLLDNYESDREQYNRLLEQSHNDKQTISRILKQNNDLKMQFQELQDAYVNVTKQNLDLATKLQDEQFKLKQLTQEAKENKNLNQESQKENVVLTASSDINDDQVNEWGDEDGAELIKKDEQKSTLMDTIKQKLEYLEKENKDLNDYIVLMNKKLEEKNQQHTNYSQENQNSNNQTENINNLKETIKELELEKGKLFEKLEIMRSTNNKSSSSNSADEFSNSHVHLNNMKLLEEKFNKVMKDNADLIEKNQELEHVIQQLQFETETIIDYISMYQIERLKLNERYKIKDESIRSLATQLQVNKLAIQEISNYLNAFKKISSTTEEDGNKSDESKLKEKQLDTNNNANETESSGNETVIINDTDASSNEYENGQANSDNNEEKKSYLLNKIQHILNDLTTKTSTELSKASSADSQNVVKYLSNNSLPNGGPTSLLMKNGALANQQEQTPIDPLSVAHFRSQTFLCSNCYGDLFIV